MQSRDQSLIQAEFLKVREELRAVRADPIQWPFREAAAVLSRFQPDLLNPNVDDGKRGWENFLPDSEAVSVPGGGDWWRLRADVRREALKRLGSRERLLQALSRNQHRPDDAVQRRFEAI